MNKQAIFSKKIFLDIETVSEVPDYQLLNEQYKRHWEQKISRTKSMAPDVGPEDLYHEKAAIYAEFGKIICISIGIFCKVNDGWIYRSKSFISDNEKNLLQSFARTFNTYFSSEKGYTICGHNVREFDIPYISRRLLKHQLKLPSMFDIAGKRPWQVKHIWDSLEAWKFGDYKHYTSLDLLCLYFGIDSPKNTCDGSMVHDMYWKDHDMQAIKEYCESDVRACAQVYGKLNGINCPSFFTSLIKKAS